MKDLTTCTQARVGLGAAGGSLPTAPLLALRLAHAKARDAVRIPLDTSALLRQMGARSWPSILVESAAATRDEYLRRPGLGRRLAEGSTNLQSFSAHPQPLVFVVSDGLSAPAVEHHAVPLLEKVFALLPYEPEENHPVIIAKQGRVGITDAIGEQLGANLLVLLIGERPGLSSPDSLGAYLTWYPRPGRTDADRNCVSNIHAGGLSYEKAAVKVVFLIREMQRLQRSGVSLKDNSSLHPVLLNQSPEERRIENT